MNALPSTLPPRRRRGSAFVTVLLFTFLLFTLVASILKWSLSERRLNIRASYWMEARNAAEAVAEYGFSQIATQFSSHANPPSFDPTGSSPLVLPPTHSPLETSDFFYGSHVDPNSLEIIGGTQAVIPSSGALYLIDSTDANNASDTLKGQYVYRRDIRVLAKATVVPPNGDTPVTAYVTEVVSVRGAPLFANAIFYSNNDLEIFPGPQMDIYGPVHCNGNIFISKQSTDSTSLQFHGPVHCSGDLYHAWATTDKPGQGSGGSNGEDLKGGALNFVTSTGTMVNLKNGTTGSWRDSTMGTDSTLFDANGHYFDTSSANPALTQLQSKLSSSFRQTASQTWGGNLQTEAMGVAAYNPVGSDKQIGVDGSGNVILANKGSVDSHGVVINPDAADPLGYGPHSMIDPPNASLSTGDTYYDAKHEVEMQKYSNQAGLYVQVEVTPGTAGAADSSVVKLYGWPGSAPTGTPASQVGPNGGILLGTVPAGLVSFVPYKATATLTTPGTTQVTYTTVASGGGYKLKTTTTTNGTLTQTNVPYNGSGTAGTGTSSFSGGSSGSSTGSTIYATPAAALAAAPGGGATSYALGGSTTSSNKTVAQAMYDQRQLTGVNLVQIDMSVLRGALNAAISGSTTGAILDLSGNVWGAGTAGGYNPIVTSSTGWNGAVYVEVKSSTGGTTPTSIVVANGKVSSGSSLVPALNSNVSGVPLGLTVATQAPLYVLGHFNADGSNTTASSSATTPDDGKTDAISTPTSAEVPVALAADAITILSPNFFGTASGTNTVPSTNVATGTIDGDNASSGSGVTGAAGSAAYNSLYLRSTTASANTEVAAAFITGLVPTGASASSGGAHNLPRFLEDFGGKTVAIRGSLVSMYKSKIATGTWSTRYYSPPTRNWGFDVIFQNGHFPPLTPKVMSYRRVDFSDLSLNDTTRNGQTVRGYNSWRSSFTY
jgi:hypothetical protein